MRVLGVVLAICLALSTVLALPVGEHHGITPIHCTRIDTTVMFIGWFVLYAAITTVGVEMMIARLHRPKLNHDDRIPIARVMARRA